MGWRTDWLYRLVFAEVARVWARAQKEGEGRYGPPPDFLLIQQRADADWDQAQCLGPVLREWMYGGADFEPRSPMDADAVPPATRRGMFYDRGCVQFHITADRKKVLFTFQIGPLYGQGMVFRVRGQGKCGAIDQHPDAHGWIS